MDCTTMKKTPSKTLINYGMFSLAVSPELYSIIKVCTPIYAAGARIEPPTKFLKKDEGLDRISIFRSGLLGKNR